MRLPKQLSDAVMFAHWCRREKQEPAAAARLIALSRRAQLAGVHWCNHNDPILASKHRNAMRAFEAIARTMGYSTDWPGLAPVLHRNGYDVYLPQLSY